MVGTTVPDGAKRGLLRAPPTQAALEMVKVGGAVVGFWFQRGTEQLVHNSQALKKLAAARDWQEALEIRKLLSPRQPLALNEAMSRYAKIDNPKFLSPRRPLAAERWDVALRR